MRAELMKTPKRIVLKLGSEAVTHAQGGVHTQKLEMLVAGIKLLCDKGIQVVLVSSGAINTAREFLSFSDKDISSLQALSAFGQPLLMQAYAEAAQKHQLKCAQILLTHDDFKDRTRYFNAQKTILRLLEAGIIPILNENDSISFSEITVGDNDQLAAMTAPMVDADLVVILSVTDGLYDQDPKNPGAKKFAKVDFKNQPDFLKSIATKGKSTAGRGGMDSKLVAVKKITELGIPVILASHLQKNCIPNALFESSGTFFVGQSALISARKSWIASVVRPQNTIQVDEGAYRAVMRSSSLLPIGVVAVTGHFKRGDCVQLVFKRKIFAVGIVEYDIKETKKIIGKHAAEIQKVLGSCPSEELVHRDNLVLKG